MGGRTALLHQRQHIYESIAEISDVGRVTKATFSLFSICLHSFFFSSLQKLLGSILVTLNSGHLQLFRHWTLANASLESRS